MPSLELIKKALQIRIVETAFLDLFAEGKLSGTVHTSVGQEFSALAFAGQLQASDFVVSNHRCHGHYLAFTNDVRGLLAELLGKKSGICGGVGSSQHLHFGNFYSNGIQGGIMPMAAGMAMGKKLEGERAIGAVFIGDGTLGEGVVYETLNLISLWQLPLLVVCENNMYAQSTKLEDNLAGDILARAAAFGIHTFEGHTDDVDDLIISAKAAIDIVRQQRTPVFYLVNTYRLNAHSKGDDDRDPKEIIRFRENDFLMRYAKLNPKMFSVIESEIHTEVKNLIATLLPESALSLTDYLGLSAKEPSPLKWNLLGRTQDRQVTRINIFLRKWLATDSRNLVIGEDILSPYGGAFKVTRDLSTLFPSQVWSTPISEAAITGLGNGLALSGYRPMVEIMFGDFVTLALDQIINHASKFFHMYNHQINCPLILRTPMGGRRGYGPTHSQTLDRFLIGIDGVTTVALNAFIDPADLFEVAILETGPVIIIENKADYGKTVEPPNIPFYVAEKSNSQYPVVRLRPERTVPNITLVTYGGMAGIVADCVLPLFREYELQSEVLVLSRINIIDYSEILDSVQTTQRLVVIEEGSCIGGVGSEIIATVTERMPKSISVLKVGSLGVPIPSIRQLEDQVLPSQQRIIRVIGQRFV
jgi:2-oxoisovalerate dehydrogenase E1 component